MFNYKPPRAGAKSERPSNVYPKAPPLHPHRGRRIGEATNPGPPDMPSPARADQARAPEPHDDASRRRSRALHALAQMRLLLERAAHDSGAETVSDTLSAHTAVAKPRPAAGPRHHHAPHTEAGPRDSWLLVPLIYAGAGLGSHAAQRAWSAARVRRNRQCSPGIFAATASAITAHTADTS